jgi:hypothetical protein
MRRTIEDYRKPGLGRPGPSLRRRLLRNRVTYTVEDAVLSVIRPMPAEPVNEIDLKVLGMRRSGNHAVLTWIMRAAEAGFPKAEHVFLNNCKPAENEYRLQSDYRRPVYSEEEYRRIRVRRNRTYLPVGLLMRSFEDYDRAAWREPEDQAFYGRCRTQFRAIILRDPLNLFASRLKAGYINSKSRLSLIDLYLDHVACLDGDDDAFPIFYNRWLLSEEYRADLLDRLGLPAFDGHDSTAVSFGPGSSFQGRGAELRTEDLLRRWTNFAQDQWFDREILKNDALMRITEKYFPEVLV